MELPIHVRGVRCLAFAGRHTLDAGGKVLRGAPAEHTFFLFCDVFGRFHSVQDRPAREIVRISTHYDAFFYHTLEVIRGLTLDEGMCMRQPPKWSRHIIVFFPKQQFFV
jgi:hypothetical protein